MPGASSLTYRNRAAAAAAAGSGGVGRWFAAAVRRAAERMDRHPSRGRATASPTHPRLQLRCRPTRERGGGVWGFATVPGSVGTQSAAANRRKTLLRPAERDRAGGVGQRQRVAGDDDLL